MRRTAAAHRAVLVHDLQGPAWDERSHLFATGAVPRPPPYPAPACSWITPSMGAMGCKSTATILGSSASGLHV